MLMKDRWIKRIKFISKKINIIAIYECKDEQVINICDYWIPSTVYTFLVYKKIKHIFDAVCFVYNGSQYIIFRLGSQNDWRKDVYFLGVLEFHKMLWYSFFYDRLKNEFYNFERCVSVCGYKNSGEN